MNHKITAGAALGVLALAAGCGRHEPASDRQAEPSAVVKMGDSITGGGGADRLPTQTASDWVSYADHVVVFHVDSDAEVPPAASEANITKAGEGYIARSVNVSITKTVWSRAGAPELPSTLSLIGGGWSLRNNVRQEAAMAGDARVEVGHSYITALARYSGGQWDALGGGTILPIDDGVIGHGEMKGGWPTHPDQVVAAVKGRTTSELTSLLQATQPNRVAAQYAHSGPETRFQKASQAGLR